MFNEAANVERCINAIGPALLRTDPLGSFIVVNDGSSDATGAILDRLAPQVPRLTVVHHEYNRGYGGALVTGTQTASRQNLGYVLFMDSDLTNDPKYIEGFVARMREDVDVIKATRYSLGGGVRGVPAWRVAISRTGNLLSGVLFALPLADLTNGFRAVKTSLLVDLPFQEKGFAIVMEELYRLAPIASTYAEVPYVLTSREAAASVSHFAYRPRVLFQYLKYGIWTWWTRMTGLANRAR